MSTLKFCCCDCEVVFDSEPDGTGYEQAPCPKCGYTCMTVEFEIEEQGRHTREFLRFSQATGNLSQAADAALESAADNESAAESVDDAAIADATTIERFARSGEAHALCARLDERGIEAQLLIAEDKVAVQVAASDVPQAQQVLEAYRAAQAERLAGSDGEIRFRCEECDAQISFPQARAGAVETCPQCGEFIDVPE